MERVNTSDGRPMRGVPMDDEPKASDMAVIIPVLNEQANLEILLPLLGEVIRDLAIVVDVIVVDGGSTDESRAVAERLNARVVVQEERGYGGALVTGFEATNARHVATMDADLSHHPVVVKDLWRQRGEADVVIASRYVPGGAAEMGAFRRLLSHALNRTYACVLALPVRDLSSGFRMYDRDALAPLRLRARDFDILEEILVQIYVRGGRITEIPFRYRARNSGKSHAKLLRFAWAYGRTLLRMWRLRHAHT